MSIYIYGKHEFTVKAPISFWHHKIHSSFSPGCVVPIFCSGIEKYCGHYPHYVYLFNPNISNLLTFLSFYTIWAPSLHGS